MIRADPATMFLHWHIFRAFLVILKCISFAAFSIFENSCLTILISDFRPSRQIILEMASLDVNRENISNSNISNLTLGPYSEIMIVKLMKSWLLRVIICEHGFREIETSESTCYLCRHPWSHFEYIIRIWKYSYCLIKYMATLVRICIVLYLELYWTANIRVHLA